MRKPKIIKSIYLTFMISSSSFQPALELIFLIKSIIILVFFLIILNIILIIPLNVLFTVNQDNDESNSSDDFDYLKDKDKTESEADSGDNGGDDDPSIFASVLAFLDKHKLYIAYGVVIVCGAFLLYDNWDKVQQLASYYLPKPDGSSQHGPTGPTTIPQRMEHRQTLAHPDMNLLSVPENIRRRLRETQLSFQFLDALAEQKLVKLNEQTGSYESHTYMRTRQDPKYDWVRHYDTVAYQSLLSKAYCNTYFFMIGMPPVPGLKEAFSIATNLLERAPAQLGSVTNENLRMQYGRFCITASDVAVIADDVMHRATRHNLIQGREGDIALRTLIEPNDKSSIFTKKYHKYMPFPRKNGIVLESNPQGFLLDEFKNMYAASLLITNDEPAGRDLIERLNLDPAKAKRVAQNYIEQMDLITDRLVNHVTHEKPGQGIPVCGCEELRNFFEVADIQFGFFSRGLTRQAVENTIVTGQEPLYHAEYQTAYEKKFKKTSEQYNYWKRSLGR